MGKAISCRLFRQIWIWLRTLLESSMLIRRPDVVITPHIAFFSREAQRRILDTTIENLAQFHKGAPVNVVE